jgi:hypothetical protein
MCSYLKKLRENVFPEGQLCVFLHTHAAHRSAAVKATAEQFGIDLMFIPPGCIDRLQPLDHRVFGVLKAFSRQQWRMQYHETTGGKTTREKIAPNLVKAWDRITQEVIESAWDIYEADWGEDEIDSGGREGWDGEYVPDISLADLRDQE